MATSFVTLEAHAFMASSEQIKILLADEDALRRDGLAAVLQGNAGYEVVAQCADGETALLQIRSLRPDVAVVDLNLPRVHGIELVRRVRGEELGTRIVIMAGTTDDDIIREVVRAGGDAYLLKNGPARHLVDAISYVRDGGQYFSPQLRRDGVNRHLLEEPARIPNSAPVPRSDADDDFETGNDPVARPTRDSRYGRASRQVRGGSRLRERIRENTASSDLEDRDYEILDMMAEGIRPILDRLDEIEGRIGDMETGESAVPNNVRGWLSTQIADTFSGGGTGREVALGRSLNDIEARLPKLIEDAVTARFQNMAGKLQQEIEETHLRTLETFVKNIQVKLVQRVSALEMDMSKQAEAMKQLREYSQRTEDNLSRLISGVDKLANDLPRRLPPAPDEILQEETKPQARPLRADSRRRSRGLSKNQKVLVFWAILALAITGGILLWRFSSGFGSTQTQVTPSTGTSAARGTGAASVAKPAQSADTKTKLDAADQAVERKEYSTAEEIYKDVLRTEPNNVDAMKALASVLYREDKIEESAAILEKLPKN